MAPQMMVETEIKKGKFVRVLENWDMNYSGYYMYYPSRRESSPLFRLLVDALRLGN
ncbi:LysR substrate binding domain protein [compost metagenome]